jgi:hypothetical protein
MSNKLEEFNKKIYQLVERSLNEMTEQVDPLTVQQVTSLEKINKIVEVLMEREETTGELTAFREKSTEELLELLEDEDN